MAEKLNMGTRNLSQEHIRQIQQLFPNAVTEIKNDGRTTLGIDFDVLKQELSNELIDDRQERYQMTWPDKKKSMLLANSKTNGTLRPLKEKSVDFDNTKNIYIEGDNLDVLKLLRETYLNKVKMIYIDPPYNTGKSDNFIYKDDFSQSSDEYNTNNGQYDELGNRLFINNDTNGRFHTDWLNMMYPRLKVARDLLTDDGVIFISVDDNEIDNLRKICDEIFGELNFIGVFCVNSTPNARDYGHIGKMHEYILFYSKNIETTETNLIPELHKKFAYFDEKGGFNIHTLCNSNEAFTPANRPNLYYPFYLNTKNKDKNGFYEISLEKQNGWVNVYPPKSKKNNVQFVWRWGKEEKSRKNLNKEIVGYKVGSEYKIVQKMRHSSKLIRSILYDGAYTSRRGTAEVENLLGSKIFSFPKPIELIELLLKAGTNKESLILDFFSGSGTTAHSVMKLNAEDNGNRKYILVQLPEECKEKTEAYKAGYKTICDIGEERIRRAGKKIKDELIEKKNTVGMLNDVIDHNSLDIGFRVFKLDSSNMNDVYYNPNKTQKSLLDATIDNIKPGRTGLDLLFQVMLELGVELSAKIEEKDILGKKCYFVNDNKIVACFNDNLTNNLLIELAKTKPTYAVFKDSCFSNDSVAINNEQIFKTYSPSTKVKVL